MFERYTSKLLLSPKTQIGKYVFDVYTSISHNLTATVTNHPVQYGASISDHKYDEPDQLTFQIGMSDASQDLIIGQFYQQGVGKTGKSFKDIFQKGRSAKDIFSDLKLKATNFISDSRSVNAFNALVAMKIEGTPLTCVTRLHTYNNMVITSINTDDTNETKYGLRVTVTMREIISPELQRVQVNSSIVPHAQITQTTSSGAKNTLDFSLDNVPQNKSTDYIQYVEKGGGSQR